MTRDEMQANLDHIEKQRAQATANGDYQHAIRLTSMMFAQLMVAEAAGYDLTRKSV